MKTIIHKMNAFRSILAISLLLSIVQLPAASFLGAAEQADDKVQKPEITDTFDYQLENRSDPFLPFIKEKQAVASLNMDDIVDPAETQLSGMQLFEPDQLKVVGVLTDSKGKMAMVQDLIGQGYTISLGTRIGKRGVVQDINAKGVVIEETAVTRAGKKKITKIVMALKPEGEE